MTNHVLKILPQYFEVKLNETKSFEIRRNDRDFTVFDTLTLKEIEPRAMNEKPVYTGRYIHVRVTSILGHDFEGIEPGFVVMGTAKIQQISEV